MIEILFSLIALGVLVTIHEGGHFIAARLCGVKVQAFSIGFGKPIIKFTRSEIEYRLSWIPLGGYVKMKGENLDEDSPEEADSFMHTKWWKKAIIGFAGPFANLLFGLLIFILAFVMPSSVQDQNPVIGKVGGQWSYIFSPGDSILAVNKTPVKGWYQFISKLKPDQANEIKLARAGHKITLTIPQVAPDSFATAIMPAVAASIGEVSPGMPAWRAGLKDGDIIVAVDSLPVRDWYEMRERISQNNQPTVMLTVLRGTQKLEKTMPLETTPLTAKQRMIGITQAMPVSIAQSFTPLEAVRYGYASTVNFIYLNYVGLYKMFSQPEQLKSSLGGPVMMMSMSSQSAKKGWNSWLMFFGAISLILMIMNLLPIPVLDGGHIMFAFIQAITGKPLPRKTQLILQNIGVAILFGLMIFAFYNDFSKVFSRAMSMAAQP